MLPTAAAAMVLPESCAARLHLNDVMRRKAPEIRRRVASNISRSDIAAATAKHAFSAWLTVSRRT